MRFHLVHVPGVDYQVKLPLVFFHKLSMLIAHVTSDQGLVMESMDLRSNGMVLQTDTTKVFVLLEGSNLFILVKGSDGGNQLDRLYKAITGNPCPNLVDYIKDDWPGLMMKEQVLCPSCLAEEVLEEAGYCSLGKEGLHRCKRTKEHKEFPATFKGQCRLFLNFQDWRIL